MTCKGTDYPVPQSNLQVVACFANGGKGSGQVSAQSLAGIGWWLEFPLKPDIHPGNRQVASKPSMAPGSRHSRAQIIRQPVALLVQVLLGILAMSSIWIIALASLRCPYLPVIHFPAESTPAYGYRCVQLYHHPHACHCQYTD